VVLNCAAINLLLLWKINLTVPGNFVEIAGGEGSVNKAEYD
jgi:hypothetical protein